MKKALLFLITVALLTTSVFAQAPTNHQSDVNEVTLEGSFGSASKGAEVAIQVYRKGMSQSNITEGTSQKAVLIYQYQTTAGNNGDYTFKIGFPADAGSDYYSAKIICSKPYSVTDVSDILYKREEDVTEASKKLEAAANSNDYAAFKKILTDTTDPTQPNYKLALGIGETFSDIEVNQEKVFELLYTYYKNNEVDTSDMMHCLEMVQLCEALSAVSDGTITNMFDYADVFGVESSRVNEFLDDAYATDSFKKKVTSSMAAVSDPADFMDKFYENFVLAAVYEPNGYTSLLPLLQEFAAEIGVQKSAVTSGVCRSIAGSNYKEYSGLKSAITTAGGSGGAGGAGGSGGGGGAAGSGSASDDKIVALPPSTAVQPELLPTNIFDDIASVSWAEEAIVALAEREVIAGKGDNKFCPNDNITREEFAKIIALTFFDDKAPAAIEFKDVPQNAWYYKPVAIAYGVGIVEGIGNSLFGTGEYISRQDAAVMACRAAERAGIWSAEENDNEGAFFDDNDIADYAKNAVYTLYEKGVVNGKGDSVFQPKARITRAETAKIVYALLQM